MERGNPKSDLWNPPLYQVLLISGGRMSIVSAISVWEIAIKFSIGKLTLPLPIDEWYSLARTHSGIVIESLNPLDAIASTQLPDNFHKDPADRIIVAIARRYGIPLVTCDAKILNYPHVQTIW
ncbi:type II toxin-antitoxin system VapC family toxin [Nostoc sp. CHAB 5834]|nr:type II toxin-antitoxin system VapC family toxin [Nostoc sp. CHAB 5834]